MYQKNNVYTPQISRQAGFVLRRIAWGLGTQMTKALNHAILALVLEIGDGARMWKRNSIVKLLYTTEGNNLRLISFENIYHT